MVYSTSCRLIIERTLKKVARKKDLSVKKMENLTYCNRGFRQDSLRDLLHGGTQNTWKNDEANI